MEQFFWNRQKGGRGDLNGRPPRSSRITGKCEIGPFSTCGCRSAQKMTFPTSCRLNGSPGPIPGAPLKSPMVSLTTPVLPTENAPDERLIRLKRLYISARSCTQNRSLTVKFLNTEKSTSANPGPLNTLRPTSPLGSVVPGQPTAPGTQKVAGLIHCSPPMARLKARFTPAKGLPIRFNPGRCVPEGSLPVSMLKGWPVEAVIKVLNCQPFVSHRGPWEEPGMS